MDNKPDRPEESEDITLIDGLSEDTEEKTLMIEDEEEITLIEREEPSPSVKTSWEKGGVIDSLYRIENIVTGGMGSIYFVEHLKWGIKLVVKSPIEKLLTEEIKRRFVREAETWVDLGKHPNIATAFYVRELNGIPRIFIEYVDGGSLSGYLKEKRELPQILDMAIQFCEGIRYAHNRGLVHRDIKPDNVLLMKDGTVKITDFGLVKTKDKIKYEIVGNLDRPGNINSEDWQTMTHGGAMGTPPYMPPEQWTDADKADKRSDIYSFGIMLYEMICGRRPFERDPANPQPPTLAYQIMHRFNTPPDPSSFRPDIPPEIGNILMKCLEKKPQDRYSSFEELQDLLTGLYAQVSGRVYDRKLPGELELRTEDLNNRALSYMDLGKKQEAKYLLEDAIKLDPHSISANINLILLLMDERWDSYENIHIRFKALKDGNPRNPLLYYYEAIFELEWGNVSTALSLVAKAKEIDGYNPLLNELEHVILSIPKFMTFGGKGGKITSTGFLGKDRAVSFDGNSLMEIWDLRFGGLRGKCFEPSSHMKFETFDLAVSPDFKYIVSAHGDDTVKLWDPEKCQFIRNLYGHTNIVRCVDFSPDGKEVFSSGADGIINIWNHETGECVKSMGQDREVGNILCGKYSPSGKYIVIGTQKNRIYIWNLEKGTCVKEIRGHGGPVTSISFSPDKKYILSSSEDRDLKLWNMKTGELVKTFSGHTSGIECCDFSSNGHYMASGDRDGIIKIWSAEGGECIRTIREHRDAVTKIKFSSDCNHILTASRDKTLRYIPLSSDIYGGYRKDFIIVKPRTVEESFKNETLFQELLAEGEKFLKEHLCARASNAFRLALQVPGYERDGRALTGLIKAGVGGKRKELKDLWFVKDFTDEEEAVSGFDMSENGKIAYCCTDNMIRLMSFDTGEQIGSFSGHKDNVFQVRISSDGNYILSAGKDRTVKLRNISSKEVKTFSGQGDVNAIAFFPGSPYIATGGGMTDSSIKIWDVKTDECLRIFQGHKNSVNAIAMIKNGENFITASEDNTLKLWNVDSDRYLANFKGHAFPVNDVSVSREGLFFASASSDKTVKLWREDSSDAIKTFSGHSDKVTCVDITSDGLFVVSGSSDKTVRLWNGKTGECMRVLEEHKDGVTEVRFSHDGRYIISSSSDKTMKIWEIDWEWVFEKEKFVPQDLKKDYREHPILIEPKTTLVPARPDDSLFREKEKTRKNVYAMILIPLLPLLILFLWLSYDSQKKFEARAIMKELHKKFSYEFEPEPEPGQPAGRMDPFMPTYSQFWNNKAEKMKKIGKRAIYIIANEGLTDVNSVVQMDSLKLLEEFRTDNNYKKYIKTVAFENLVKLLDDEEPVIRGKSALLLAHIGATEALPDIKKALEKEKKRWTEMDIEFMEENRIPQRETLRTYERIPFIVNYTIYYYNCTECHGPSFKEHQNILMKWKRVCDDGGSFRLDEECLKELRKMRVYYDLKNLNKLLEMKYKNANYLGDCFARFYRNDYEKQEQNKIEFEKFFNFMFSRPPEEKPWNCAKKRMEDAMKILEGK